MQSNNPVFARSEGFNGRGANAPAGYSDPSTWGTGAGDPYATGGSVVDHGRMTVDSIVQKTAISVGTVVVAAFVTWWFIGPMDTTAALGTAQALAFGGAIIGFGLAMVNSFKKVVSPPLVIAYALVEGVFVGAFTKAMVAYVGGDPGIVGQAVVGTFAAFFGTLFAYKFFNIQVTAKFRKVVMGALVGFVALALLNLVLSFFDADFGFRNMGLMGLLVSIVAVVIACFVLILDFDQAEKGIAAGLPERESWRAAFGLTVTLIWLYIEMLRIAAILRGD